MNLDDYFETIVSEHYEALFGFAMSLTRAESDAYDLTQQTFYVWGTKGHRRRTLSKVKTWLFTTLYRVFLKTGRRQNRFHHHSLDEVAEQFPALPAEVTSEADYSEVFHALAKVDEIFQPSLALFYLEDYSYKEIAAILAVPLGTVKSAEKAATAGDAATVGGRTVQRFSFNAPEGTGPTLVLNTGGLALTARCDAGPAQSVTATSAVDNAIIHVHAAQSVGASTYKANDDFDVGDMFDPLPASGGTNAIGQIVYVRQDGGTVTAEYLAQETPTGCVFGGTAIS